MRRSLLTLMTALAVAAFVPSQQDAPAAVLVKVQGNVQVKLGSAAPVAGTVGARLSVGDQVLPAPGGEAVVVHRTGRTQVVTEATAIEAESGPAQGDMFTRTVHDAADVIASLERDGNLSADVFLLKGEVLDALGRFEEARAAFDKADGMLR